VNSRFVMMYLLFCPLWPADRLALGAIGTGALREGGQRMDVGAAHTGARLSSHGTERSYPPNGSKGREEIVARREMGLDAARRVSREMRR
jgi:hypothetical protein